MVSENYAETTGRKVLEGRFFNAADYTNYRPVAIIDRQIANLLFEGKSAVGKDIYTDGTRLTVVGTIETKSDFLRKEAATGTRIKQSED